jgi:hypothetical protein
MKKILATLISVVSLMASSAWADAVSIEYGKVDVMNGMAHQTGVGFIYRKDVNTLFSADVGVASLRTDDAMGRTSNAVTTRTEVGATARPLTLGMFTVYNRLVLGNQSGSWTNNLTRTSGNQDFNYWSNELGLVTKFNNFDAKVGYRWRDSTGGNYGFRTTTARVGAGYALTKTQRVGLSYDDIRGDYAAKQWGINYSVAF